MHLVLRDRTGTRVAMNPNQARRMLEDWRWAAGPVCPKCEATNLFRPRSIAGWYRCPACKSDFTVRTGTVMAQSHVSLEKWILIMYLWAENLEQYKQTRKGISSLKIAAKLKISRKSAWRLKQKIANAGSSSQNEFLFELGEDLFKRISLRKDATHM